MGFLSFLRRPNTQSHSNLRSQAYSSTTAADPPRKGTYPISGNGSSLFESLRQSRPNPMPGQMTPTAIASPSESAHHAPPPSVPRLQKSELGLRPATAPIQSSNLSTHRSSSSSTAGTTSRASNIRKPRLTAITTPTHTFIVDPNTGARELARSDSLFGLHPAIKPPILTNSHVRRASAHGLGPVASSVDLLDAQSEIKPADFRSRVNASGARDYGEDVADRNLAAAAANSTRTFSPAPDNVDPSTVATPPLKDMRLPGPTQPTAEAWKASTGSSLRASRRYRSTDFSGRTLSLSSLSQMSFAKQQLSTASQRDGLILESQRRISSIEGYPPEDAVSRRPRSVSCNRTDDFTPSSPVTTLQARPEMLYRSMAAEGRYGRRRPTTSSQRTANELGIYPADYPGNIMTPPLSPSSLYGPTYRRTKRTASVSSVRSYGTAAAPPEFGNLGYDRGHLMSTRPMSRDNISITSAAFSLPVVHSSREKGNTRTVGQINIETRADDELSPAPSPHVMRRFDDRSSDFSMHDRTRSLLSSEANDAKPLDEIYEHVPMRMSSLRHWSISSTTPTTASSGVNSSQQPHPHHTPNTSIDIANTSDVMDSSPNSLFSTKGKPRPHVAMEDSIWAQHSASIRTHSNFNIDDYVSSDDDSFNGDFHNPNFSAPNSAREIETGLLWRDSGYGASGFQLPGLFDSIPEVISTSPPKRPLRHPQSTPPPILAQFGGNGHSINFDSDEELDATSKLRPNTGIPVSAIADNTIEPERREKADVRSAMRLRKQSKKILRTRDQHMKGNGNDDEANNADVE